LNKEDKVWDLLEMCFYGHLEQVKKLLSEGIDVNSTGRNGMTPLMAARDGENKEIIEFLLSLGAEDNQLET
jgi:ankyrin repeat protein